jgi:hypothetical protein
MNAYLHDPADPAGPGSARMRTHDEEGMERLVTWERRASEGVPAPGYVKKVLHALLMIWNADGPPASVH